MSLFDIESIHQKYLQDLIKASDNPEEVQKMYNEKRKELERNAITDKFVPVLTYKEVSKRICQS